MPDYSKIADEDELYEDETGYKEINVTVPLLPITVNGEPQFAYEEVAKVLGIEEKDDLTEDDTIRALNRLQDEYIEAICERHESSLPPEKLH